jgi:two-component sensor histidine kinase
VYFGMLLNELVTNSFTHAFGPGHPDPTIALTLEDLGESFRFTYRDNGPGFLAEPRSCHAHSLGITMLFEITEDLGGRVIQEAGPGTSFVFVLPKHL